MQQTALVSGQEELGPDVFLLTLEAPDLAQRARPGQFAMLRVDPGRDPLLARPFSIHAVGRGRVAFLYRVVGRGTRTLSRRRPGEEIFLWGPLGRGFDLSAAHPLLVAGGLGAAPLFGAARELLRQHRDFQMLLGLPSITGFSTLVKRLEQAAGPRRLVLVTEDGSAGERGLVTGPFLDLLPRAGAVLACGPLGMLRAVARLAARQPVACQVSLETPMACGVGACLGCVLPATGGGYLRVCQEGPVLAAGRVDWARTAESGVASGGGDHD
ncbi:MAG: dihydroorotate dehydrogenase electron transfer subunit [Deltaproteobacteria bacterium]|nr:dihydroorotate dehydrogenase electron transfer subunit [Deltaproteobacteria bacterium]